ncbi:EIF4E [Artemisia annua]|uniref:EIF4E n=1 Tax=Artemisia annua TaxID=35608 RepID=A0A2U1N1G7_ARTAN|nr:EIF4E [Artemisia annua]
MNALLSYLTVKLVSVIPCACTVAQTSQQQTPQIFRSVPQLQNQLLFHGISCSQVLGVTEGCGYSINCDRRFSQEHVKGFRLEGEGKYNPKVGTLKLTKKSKATKDRKLQTLPHNFPNVLIFILTAKVGGLGKIMGANRVIIFHPHWNPTLDIQMRLSFLMFYITLQNEWGAAESRVQFAGEWCDSAFFGPRQEKIALWTKNAANKAAQMSIGKQWKELLDYNDIIGFIFHHHISQEDAKKLDRGAKINTQHETLYVSRRQPECMLEMLVVIQDYCTDEQESPIFIVDNGLSNIGKIQTVKALMKFGCKEVDNGLSNIGKIQTVKALMKAFMQVMARILNLDASGTPLQSPRKANQDSTDDVDDDDDPYLKKM